MIRHDGGGAGRGGWRRRVVTVYFFRVPLLMAARAPRSSLFKIINPLFSKHMKRKRTQWSTKTWTTWVEEISALQNHWVMFSGAILLLALLFARCWLVCFGLNTMWGFTFVILTSGGKLTRRKINYVGLHSVRTTQKRGNTFVITQKNWRRKSYKSDLNLYFDDWHSSGTLIPQLKSLDILSVQQVNMISNSN